MTIKHEAAASAVQAIPAAAVVGSHFAGWTISDVAAVVGIGFILLQSAFLVWRWVREARSTS